MAIVAGLAGLGIEAHGTDDPNCVRDAPVLIADPTLAAGVLDSMPSLRWVQSTWAGVDALMLEQFPPGVVLTRLDGVFHTQMREFVFGHLLAHQQGIVEGAGRRSWVQTVPEDLAGRRLGIMGTGSIGRALAETGRHFEMEIVGCSRTGRPDPAFERVFPVTEKADFADGLDVLVVTLPATPGTAGVVNGRLLDRLARGSVLVNVGRGTTVEVDDVIDRLRSGRLAKAILDVLPHEPLPDGHPWWDAPGLVITCHTAAWSRPDDIVEAFHQNHRRWLRGLELAGTVDLAAGY